MTSQNSATTLLPDELRSTLPALYAQEHVSLAEQIVHAKFFTPDAGWTWYVIEGSPEGDDFVFFGYVIGHEREAGYFALSDLAAIRGPLGLPIERDLYFRPKPLGELCPELKRV